MNQHKLLENKNIIVFGEDFKRHPHALEHLLGPLFDNNQFIWVQTIGLRSPKLTKYDFFRVIEKLKHWNKKPKTNAIKIPENIHIVSPFMIPFNQFKLIRILNTMSVNHSVRKLITQLRFTNIITIASVPNAADYVGNFNEDKIIYFCVDEFSLWPGLDYDLVSKMEKKLLSKASLVIATSKSLAQTKKIPNKKTHIIGHGVQFEHFNIGKKQGPKTTFKICYFGLFDERSNQTLLKSIAQKLPDIQIDIIGNVVCNIDELKPIQNIHFLGMFSYQELPNTIKPYDAFILPYKLNELTKNINPLKLKEYLSTSRLVITTRLPEVEDYKEHLCIADSVEDFINFIESFRNDTFKPNFEKTINYISEYETWNAKATLLTNIINEDR